MGLFVKWGSGIEVAEYQTLYAIRRVSKNAIPVPDIYGWRLDGGERFIYMELFKGPTLERAWNALGTDDRISICSQLQTIVHNLRQLKQDPHDLYIGRFLLFCVRMVFGIKEDTLS